MTIQPVFLLSLPRSGSTLLQRSLALHPEIATTTEPWVLLPLLELGDPRAARTHGGHHRAVTGTQQFLSSVQGNPSEAWADAVGAYASRLYQAASCGQRYFLDKTPRYSLHATRLRETFPDAPIVILWRNPLAVVASIIERWRNGRWLLLNNREVLFRSPPELLRVMDLPGPTLSVRYEDLVLEPVRTITRVTDFLGLEPHAQTIGPGDLPTLQWSGTDADPDLNASAETFVPAGADRWPDSFHSPVRRLFGRRYLDHIGAGLARMGYDAEELLIALNNTPSDPLLTVHDLISSTADVIARLLGPSSTGARLRERPILYYH